MESIRWAFNFRNWSPMKEEWMFCLSLIQQEERERISKFVFKKDAKGSLAGRLLMRKAVSEKYHIPWSDFKLERSDKGRPFFQPLKGDVKFDFNVSHQGKWVVLAAESKGLKIGIDVMEIQSPLNKNVPEFFRLMQRQFTAEEWKIIKESPCQNAQLKSFYRNWCLKEAFVKSVGVGISFDLQSISFTPLSELSCGSPIMDTKVMIDGKLDSSWFFEECLLDDTHIVAVASQHYRKPMAFEVLSFEQMVFSSKLLSLPDELLAEEFMLKKENS